MQLEQQLARIMVESGLDHFKAEQASKRMIEFFNEKVTEEVSKRDGLTVNERNLAADVLKLAGKVFANHEINEIDQSVWDNWTGIEIEQFLADLNTWSIETELYPECDNVKFLNDWQIIEFLSHKLQYNQQ